ncbi:hypothetical protein [Caulobacter sp. S45]|uniref:hypothetical protein n=1 Tax=Caulobacter sp. S45 TaxID=1641861 RepID=UPI00131C81CC|nr:hypothetical protein [Caulobacter sp. S45]
MRAPSTALTATLLAALAIALPAHAQEDWGREKSALTAGSQYAASKAMCRAVEGVEIPARDRPSARVAAGLKGCDSEALYYGEHGPADPVKARLCAAAESDGGEVDSATAGPQGGAVFSGRAILMMIYANGLGVPRNLDLATHLACNLDGAPAESDGRVHHLAQLKAKGPGKRRFDYCDDITSGMGEGFCAARDAVLTDAKRKAALDGLAIAPGARTAYAALRTAADAYATQHGDGEVDLSGTARDAIATEEEQETKKAFTSQLQAVLAGRVPPASPAQASAADAALNAAYRKLQARGDKVQKFGTVTFKDVRDAQRAGFTIATPSWPSPAPRRRGGRRTGWRWR